MLRSLCNVTYIMNTGCLICNGFKVYEPSLVTLLFSVNGDIF